MTSTKPSAGFFPFDLPWFSLTQPINGGWTFGNVIVNAQNSSAPATEMEIVSRESYGRQIGKLLDAVAVLVEERSGARPKEVTELVELKARVDEIKTDGARQRIEQVRHDLDRLRREDPDAYQAQVEALSRLLDARR